MHHDSSTLPCACTALRKASRAVSRVYDEALTGAGMTTPQFAILRNLARLGAVPLSRLADLLVMDRTSLYRMIVPMVRHGWLRIDAAPRGRSKAAILTPDGETAMIAATPLWERAQARIVETLGTANWAALAASLGDVTAIAVGDAA